MITQPFNKTFISLLLYYIVYPKYVLRRLLTFLFVKRSLYFLTVIISYFICHWNGQLNFSNYGNLFCPCLSVSFIKCFLFLCYSNQSKILVPMSYHQILDINFSTLYFRFPYDLRPSVSFLSMNELYYCTYLQVSPVHQHINLYY